MRLSRRSAVLVSAILLGSTALGFEPAIHRDLNAEDGSLRLTIGAVRVPLWSAAFAQSARDLSLDDVTITLGTANYKINRIEFSGVTSSEAEIRALFDTGSTEPLGTRLEKISAKRVSIPEIVAEERVGDMAQRHVYRNVVLNDVERGRIAQMTGAGSTGEINVKAGKMATVQEKFSATDTDLAAMVRIYGQRSGPQPEPMTRIQGSATVESSTFIDDKGTTVRVGRSTLRDFQMRPTEESWAGYASLMSAVVEVDKPSDKDFLRLMTGAVDVLNSFQVGLIEANDIEMTFRADMATGTARVKRIAYSSATPSQPSEARIEGLSFEMPEGRFSVDLVSYSGFSLEPTAEGLRALRGKRIEKLEELDPATIRSLIPTIGTVRYAGLGFDFEAPRKEGGGVERVQASVKDAELTADKPLNGIPTNLRVAVRNFAMPVPTDSKDESVKPLVDLGYKNLDISYTVAANWNEAGNELLVRDVTVGGADMGQVSLKAVVGGVTRDVFSPDTAVATAAALGASARSAELVVENGGLFDRFLEQEARKQKKTPEAVRREYGAAAAIAVPAMLGNSEQAKALGQAVSRFIARPTRLRITARAKNPAGLGVSDLAGGADPAALLEKLEVTATVDERL